MTSIHRITIFLLLISLIPAPILFAQDDTLQQRLIDYWEIGETLEYNVTTWGRDIGYSRAELVGIVDHASLGRALLFKSETVIKRLTGQVSTRIEGELFTQGLGYPGFYVGQYLENNKRRTMQGRIAQEGFVFMERIGESEQEVPINAPPWSFIVDRQTIPHWNLAFFNEDDLDKDTLKLSILIPYLKKRAIMQFAKKPDKQIEVMGETVNCDVFLSIRTDEFYYITPDKRVARVEYPGQGLEYNLVAITKKEQPPKQE